MVQLQSLPDRLEAFRAAQRNLKLQPLTDQKEVDQFWVEYSAETVDFLKEWVVTCTNANNKLIFTGHRGCGKSTLLWQFCKRVEKDFFTVFFSIADRSEASGVNHINILFSMAIALMEAAEEAKVDISFDVKKKFYLWFAKHTHIESNEFVASIEASVEASVGWNNLIAKLFATIKGALKTSSTVREEVTQEFERKISELTDRINEIAEIIKQRSEKPILVVIDDIDKLPLDVIGKIFRDNLQPLFEPQFRIIYTIPIAAIRDLSILGVINAYIDRPEQLRVTKFFRREDRNAPESKPNHENVELFQKILFRRLPQELIELDVANRLILKSGGVLRELMRLASQCCDQAIAVLNREKRVVTIDGEILEKAEKEIRLDFASVLGKTDYTLLKSIYDDCEPEDALNKRFLDLLHNLYILEYRNDDYWFDLHPLVADLLRRRSLIP